MNILRRILGTSALGAALGTTIVAIAGGGCSSPAGPKYPDLTSFCNGRATAECSMAVLGACAIPSSTVCIAKRQQLCVTNAPAATKYNPSAAEACIAQVSSAYADAMLTLAESNANATVCLPVFDGPGALGTPCQADSECKVSTGLRCVNSGTCQIPQSVAAGYPCDTASAQCVPGFHCDSTAHFCVANGALNAPCSGQMPCGPDLQCPARVCAPKSPDGTACATNDECLHGICNGANTGMMGVCVSEITLASMEPFCIASR